MGVQRSLGQKAIGQNIKDERDLTEDDKDVKKGMIVAGDSYWDQKGSGISYNLDSSTHTRAGMEKAML